MSADRSCLRSGSTRPADRAATRLAHVATATVVRDDANTDAQARRENSMTTFRGGG